LQFASDGVNRYDPAIAEVDLLIQYPNPDK